MPLREKIVTLKDPIERGLKVSIHVNMKSTCTYSYTQRPDRKGTESSSIHKMPTCDNDKGYTQRPDRKGTERPVPQELNYLFHLPRYTQRPDRKGTERLAAFSGRLIIP